MPARPSALDLVSSGGGLYLGSGDRREAFDLEHLDHLVSVASTVVLQRTHARFLEAVSRQGKGQRGPQGTAHEAHAVPDRVGGVFDCDHLRGAVGTDSPTSHLRL